MLRHYFFNVSIFFFFYLTKTCFSFVISHNPRGLPRLASRFASGPAFAFANRADRCGFSASSALYFISAYSCNSRITCRKLSTRNGHMFSRNCLSLINTMKLHDLLIPRACNKQPSISRHSGECHSEQGQQEQQKKESLELLQEFFPIFQFRKKVQCKILWLGTIRETTTLSGGLVVFSFILCRLFFYKFFVNFPSELKFPSVKWRIFLFPNLWVSKCEKFLEFPFVNQ